MYPKWNCQGFPEHHEKCCPEKEPCMKPQCYDQVCCDIPKIPKPHKECVETFKCAYKLYRITYYCLYKQCGQCGHEFDHHKHQGMCPKCGHP